MSEHSPGPWVYRGRGYNPDIDDANGEAVCRLLFGRGGNKLRSDSVVWANAALIIAAPDLFAALNEARLWIPKSCGPHLRAQEAALAAIAKATGEVVR